MDNEFTRDDVLFKLHTIAREISFMSDTTFANKIKDGEMVFDRSNWGEQEKVQIKIKITKTKVKDE
jgi:hypothetical protein